MAFINYGDVKDVLPTVHNKAKIELTLAVLESDLENLGLTFDSLVAKTLELKVSNQDQQSIFSYRHFQNITSITVKNDDGNYSKVLTEGEDYTLYSNVRYDDIYNAIELKESICQGYYLEIICQEGFLTSTPEDLVNAIKFYFIDWVRKDNQGGAEISTSSTAQSSVSYDFRSRTNIPDDPMEYNKIIKEIHNLL